MHDPVDIAFGVTDLDIGGAERMLVELVARLDRNRWRPSVVCLQTPGFLARFLDERGIPVDSLEIRGATDFPRALGQWSRILRERRPALLQTFLFHANLLGRLAAASAKVRPVVAGIRVADPRSRGRLWIDRMTARMVDRYVCVSEEVRQFTEASGIAREKLLVIPNGVDVERFASAAPIDPEAFGGTGDAALLVAIGRLDRQKGPDVLLQALEVVGHRANGRRWVLAFLGDGPMRAALEADAARRGLAGQVRFLGRRDDVERWLAACEGLVLASRWEGMPNVVLEAMAAGRPVVATRVEGTGSLVRPGETGWLVPPEDPAALADAIRELLADADRRRRFGAAAKNLAADFSFGRMVESYERLYRELLGIEARNGLP